MTGIPCSLDPLGSGLGVPFKPDFVVYEGRPQPANGGQNNLNTTLKLYYGVYNLIIAGGGSNSAYGDWAGFAGGSGAAFKGRIKIKRTIEVPVQVGAKTDKNTYPLHKDSFLGDFITAQGAGGATDNNWGAFFYGALIINQVDWAEVLTTEIKVDTQRSDSYQPIPGTNYGQCFHTGYMKLTYLGQR